jgi:hypothetical protein
MVSDRTFTPKVLTSLYVLLYSGGMFRRTADRQMPWLETPIIYDVRAKPRNIASLTGTKDLQMVRLVAATSALTLVVPVLTHRSTSPVVSSPDLPSTTSQSCEPDHTLNHTQY